MSRYEHVEAKSMCDRALMDTRYALRDSDDDDAWELLRGVLKLSTKLDPFDVLSVALIRMVRAEEALGRKS